jgi:hypothetical protein
MQDRTVKILEGYKIQLRNPSNLQIYEDQESMHIAREICFLVGTFGGVVSAGGVSKSLQVGTFERLCFSWIKVLPILFHCLTLQL